MTTIQIKVPIWLDRIFAWPVMLYRQLKFGYSYRRIFLGEDEWTILDQQDYYRLGHLKWYLSGNGKKFYAFRNFKTGSGRTKMVSLHREIMKAPKGSLVDHRNGIGLDNRRANLRPATRSQNMCNRQKTLSKTSSRFRGVHFDRQSKKWIAKIAFQKKRIWLGVFDSEIDAAKTYDNAAKKYHGEFARLNFPEGDSVS